MRRIVIKIGTAALIDRRHCLDQKVISGLTAEIVKLRQQKYQVIIVSSGAIASGIKALGYKEKLRSMPAKQAVAAVGQPIMIQTWQKYFGKYALWVGQVLLTRDDLAVRGRCLNASNTLNTLLSLGAIPIINENDTVAVEEIKVGDNDTLAALVARAVRASRLIILSDIDGIYDRPISKKGGTKKMTGRIIKRIPRVTAKIMALGRSSSQVSDRGVGGIATKIAAAKLAAQSGVTTIIANGKRPGILTRIMTKGDAGTAFLPV